MANRKEWEMLFNLNAKMGSEFSGTFKNAQSAIDSLQNEIQALNKAQKDISAYQKQQNAVEATRQHLSTLQQQYDNIQAEIEQTGESSSDLKNKLLAKQEQIDKTSAALNRQTQKLDEMGNALKEAGVNMNDLGQSSAQLSNRIEVLKQKQEEAAQGAHSFGSKTEQAFSAAHEAIVAAGIATALKEIYRCFTDNAQASMDFESAMIGVAKTTDLTDEEFQTMSASIRDLSTEIPATTDEIAAVAEAAGQLGIQKKSLLDFTETMVMLGTATNMTADEAATALARFANITGMSASNYDRLGATIVGLGNKFATTESEITAMSTRLASAGTLAGLSEAEILALSAAMSSVGIEAEAGGTAMTQTLNAIESAVANGGDTLYEFARIAGMSASEFSEAWESNAIGALTSFVRGLGNLESQGESAVLALDELGLSGVRQSNMLQSLALAADQMDGAVALANQEWRSNTALLNEAGKRYASTKSHLTTMQNAYKNIKTVIGDAYTPALKEAYTAGTNVLNSVAQFIKQNPALVNAVTAFFGVIGSVAAALTAYSVAAKVAATASAILTASIPGVNIIMGVTAAVAAVTAGIVAFSTAASNDAVPSISELTESAKGMREAMDEASASYNDTVSSTLAAAGVADTYIAKLEELEAAGLRSNEEQQQYHNTLALLCQVVPDLAESINLETDTIEGGTAALRANTEAWKQNAMQQAYQEQLTALYSQYSAVLIEAEENSIGLTKAQYQQEAANKKYNDTLARMDELWNEAAKQAEDYNSEYNTLADATNFLTQEYYDLENSLYGINNEMWEAERSAKVYQKAIEEDQAAVAAAEEEIALAEEAVNNLTAAMQDSAEATDEVSGQEKRLQEIMNGVRVEIDSIVESYTEAYNAAFESISGQYQLWDEAASVVATSAGSINSALESQTAYWQNYNDNLQSLTERSSDIAGLSDMISSFADGSEESVNAIAGMASASDEDLARMVANYQELQAAQATTSESLADLETGFSNSMDNIVTDVSQAVSDMNLSDEARAAAQETIKGFIDGASSMLPGVQEAYQKVANAASAALRPVATKVKGNTIPAYAAGTNSAAPGFALVGENGPELVYFQGGEQVITATETKALQDKFVLEPQILDASGETQSWLSMKTESMTPDEAQIVAIAPQMMMAMSAYGNVNSEPHNAEYSERSAGSSINVQVSPVYNITGKNDPDTLEAVLQQHDEDLRDYILDVIKEANIDTVRGNYS